jgi:hypothetical protein
MLGKKAGLAVDLVSSEGTIDRDGIRVVFKHAE